jgi:hypothetical protein
MPKTSEADIRALVDSFVEQLTQQIRISALESVRDALLDGNASASAAPARRGHKPGPKPKTAAPKATKPKRGKRGRRTPEEIEADKAAILAHVKSNPGTAMGDISAALGQDAETIRAQVNDLLKAKALRKEGERRGTRYFAGGGSAGGAKKATKRKKKGSRRGKKSGKRETMKKTARR